MEISTDISLAVKLKSAGAAWLLGFRQAATAGDPARLKKFDAMLIESAKRTPATGDIYRDSQTGVTYALVRDISGYNDWQALRVGAAMSPRSAKAAAAWFRENTTMLGPDSVCSSIFVCHAGARH